MKIQNLVQAGQVLGSKWDGLSPHLLASFFMVENKNGVWARSQSDLATVVAPLTEASLEMALNWQSPFEAAGPETKAPALMAMLSSGALQPVIEASMGAKNNSADASAAQKRSADFLQQFEGRTGITRLNSTQVFAGMPPMKIQINALFRAWDDPAREVEAPVEKLIQWALPIELSKDGSILARAAKTARGEMSFVEALFPSAAPVRVGMTYKGRTYSPMVIESIGKPLDAPVDRNGRHVELVIPMTLCSLTALDRELWDGFKTMAL